MKGMPSACANEQTVVVTLTDHQIDKYTLLEKVLELSGFFDVLDDSFKKSKKEKSEFKIVVKPNLSMMLRRADVGTYTDPFLLVHLLRLILRKGFTNLAVVESGNLYGNWFQNRSVAQVAARQGLLKEEVLRFYQRGKDYYITVKGGGVNGLARLVDLGEEPVAVDIGKGEKIEVGKTWVDGDFRIGFAKLKSHFYSRYTATIKNIYGCLPEQDKVQAYHCKRRVGAWTALIIHLFPVHFSIVDAYTTADGWLGVKIKAIARKTHTLFAGTDIMCVDHFAGSLLRVNPRTSVMFKSMEKLQPLKKYEVVGAWKPFSPWRNSPAILALICQLIEANANIMDWAGALSTGGHDSCFPHRQSNRQILKRVIYWLTQPLNFLLDITGLQLAIRKIRWHYWLRKISDQVPLLASSPFLRDRLQFLAPHDIKFLARLIADGVNGGAEFSGHYLFVSGREIPFLSPLFITNLAVVEIINHIAGNSMDNYLLASEFERLANAYEKHFQTESQYPYCYK